MLYLNYERKMEKVKSLFEVLKELPHTTQIVKRTKEDIQRDKDINKFLNDKREAQEKPKNIHWVFD